MGSYWDAALNDPGRNKDPDPDAEYIYNSPMAWTTETRPDGSLRCGTEIKVEPCRIAVKVRKVEHERLFFEFKDEPGVLYTTNYGWSFILNTPENAEAFREYDVLRDRIAIMERQAKRMFKNLITLDNTK